MKKLLRFLAYVIFFVVALMYFSPKTSVYYFLEEQVKPYGVVVSSEEVSDNGLSLEIKHASISFKTIESANVENTDIGIYGLYNSVSVQNIVLSSAAASFVPLNIQSADIRYSIIDPLNVNAYIVGDFGEAKASYNILENNVSINLKPSEIMTKEYKNTLRTLKKDENGEYVYVKAF